MSKLVEKRKEFEAKQAKVGEILASAKNADGKYDFSGVASLNGETSEDKVKSFQALNDELVELAAEVNDLHSSEVAGKAAGNLELLKGQRAARGIPLPGASAQAKSLGQRVAESDQFKSFRESKGEIKTFAFADSEMDLKTLFETGAGWAPESTRTGRVVEGRTRPIQILDLIPSGTIDQAQVVYMEETTRTHNAAERAEGGAFAEDLYALTERTSQVRSIGTSLPVTDEQLEDVGQVSSYIDGRLRFGVMQRLDRQVLIGDGSAPNLKGIINVTNVQTQAKGSNPTFDAFHMGLTKIRVTGRAQPDGSVMHPNDWEQIRLTRTADGIYIMGNPADVGPMRLFGIPIALSDAITEGTALIGDFAQHCFLHNRRGVQVEVGYVNAQFGEGKRTIRASLRAAFVVYRPEAFCLVTGI